MKKTVKLPRKKITSRYNYQGATNGFFDTPLTTNTTKTDPTSATTQNTTHIFGL